MMGHWEQTGELNRAARRRSIRVGGVAHDKDWIAYCDDRRQKDLEALAQEDERARRARARRHEAMLTARFILTVIGHGVIVAAVAAYMLGGL